MAWLRPLDNAGPCLRELPEQCIQHADLRLCVVVGSRHLHPGENGPGPQCGPGPFFLSAGDSSGCERRVQSVLARRTTGSQVGEDARPVRERVHLRCSVCVDPLLDECVQLVEQVLGR